MDNRFFTNITITVTCDSFTETASRYDKYIGISNCHIGCNVSVHTCQPQALPVASRKNPNPHQRIDDWHPCFSGKTQHLFRSTTVNSAAAYQKYRLSGISNSNCCGFQYLFSGRFHNRRRQWLRFHPLHISDLQIAGNIHQHRSRTTFLCQVKCLPQRRQQILRLTHQNIIFRYRQCHTDNIYFLKRVSA